MSRVLLYTFVAAILLVLASVIMNIIRLETKVECEQREATEMRCNCRQEKVGNIPPWFLYVMKKDLTELISESVTANYSNSWRWKSINEEKLKRLYTLQVVCGEIYHLGNYIFSVSKGLRRLALRFNRISTLQKDTFRGSNRLQLLQITDSHTSKIKEDAFDEIKDLRQLHLNRNRLTVFNWRWFSGLTKLRTISVTDNKIERWIGSVRKANENGTAVEVHDAGTFKRLRSVRRIDAGYNQFTVVGDQLFRKVPNLEHFNLEENRIQFIGKRAFSKLKKLRILVLRGNELKTPYRDWFTQVPKLYQWDEVDLSDNPWHCNNKILQYSNFLNKLKRNNKTAKCGEFLAINCFSPQQIKGQVLGVEVTECIRKNNFTSCSMSNPQLNDSKINLMWIFIPIVITFIVVLTVIYKVRKRKCAGDSDTNALVANMCGIGIPNANDQDSRTDFCEFNSAATKYKFEVKVLRSSSYEMNNNTPKIEQTSFRNAHSNHFDEVVEHSPMPSCSSPCDSRNVAREVVCFVETCPQVPSQAPCFLRSYLEERNLARESRFKNLMSSPGIHVLPWRNNSQEHPERRSWSPELGDTITRHSASDNAIDVRSSNELSSSHGDADSEHSSRSGSVSNLSSRNLMASVGRTWQPARMLVTWPDIPSADDASANSRLTLYRNAIAQGGFDAFRYPHFLRMGLDSVVKLGTPVRSAGVIMPPLQTHSCPVLLVRNVIRGADEDNNSSISGFSAASLRVDFSSSSCDPDSGNSSTGLYSSDPIDSS